MKYFLVFIVSLTLLCSCHPPIQETDTISERGPDSIYAAYLVMARSLPDSLGKTGPYIAAEKDSNSTFLVLDSPLLAIGRLIDIKSTFAVSCVNIGDDSAVLRIYRNYNNNWTLVGLYRLSDYVHSIRLVNADSETSTNEIVLIGTYNVNSNRQFSIFKYDPIRGIVGYSGNFFTCDEDLDPETENGGYKVDVFHNTIRVDYEGNNAGVSRSLYLWRQDSLVLLRDSYIDNSSGQRILSYSINQDSCFSCGLTEVFSEKANVKSSVRYKKYWDHFFDIE